MASELKSRVLKGSVWGFFEKFSVQVTLFVVGVILARLLDPKDFGILALAMIFIGVSSAITDGGFEKAVIQRTEVSSLQLNTIFYINTAIGIVLTLILVLAAPQISLFFREPRLTPVLQVIGLGVFISSLTQLQRTLLIKELNFKKISLAHITGAIVGGVLGVVFAFMGFGVWALVISSLATQIIVLMFFWVNSSWYPSGEFSFESVKDLLPYGLNILFISIIYFLMNQSSNFIIGKFYNSRDLGLVVRGSKTPDIVVNLIHSVILRLALPAFAKIQSDDAYLLHGLKKAVQIIALIAFPSLVLLLVNAHDLTLFLFSEKWMDSVIYLQLFCVAKFFTPFVVLYREILLAKGKAKLVSKLLSVSLIIEVAIVLIMIPWGLKYVLYGLIVSSLFQFILYSYCLFRSIAVSSFRQFRWLLKYAIIGGVTAFSIFIVSSALAGSNLPLYVALLIKISTGGFCCILTALLFKVEELEYAKLARKQLRSRFMASSE